MPKRLAFEQRPWLVASLIAGIGFWLVKDSGLPGVYQIAWKGAGVEVAFSFSGERLIAHHARALDAPRQVLPLNDPFAPRPDAQFLNIKPVAR